METIELVISTRTGVTEAHVSRKVAIKRAMRACPLSLGWKESFRLSAHGPVYIFSQPANHWSRFHSWPSWKWKESVLSVFVSNVRIKADVHVLKVLGGAT